MTDGDEVFGRIQRQARSIADREGRRAPTSELLTRHALESFLDRLVRTEHADDFVLKGGTCWAPTTCGVPPRTSTLRRSAPT